MGQIYEITILSYVGSDVKDIAYEAYQMCIKYKCIVKFSFNGITLIVQPEIKEKT